MSETLVERKPRPRNRVFLKLSGGRFFTIPESAAPPYKAGEVLSDEDIERLSRVDQYHRGRAKAIHLLGIRARSCYEIKQALERLELLPAIRNGIVEELVEEGFLDDSRFCTEFVRGRIETKGFGPHRLRVELKRRGIGTAIIETVFEAELQGENQDDIAWREVRKKLGSRKADEGDIRRLSGLLRRKGLDYDVINRVMYRLLQESGVEVELD